MPPVRNSRIPTCPLPPGPPSSGNTRDFGRGAPRTRWGLAFPLLIRKNLTGDNGGVRGAASRAGQRGSGQGFSSAARSWIYPSSAGAVRGQEEPGARFNPESLLEFRCLVKKPKQNKINGRDGQSSKIHTIPRLWEILGGQEAKSCCKAAHPQVTAVTGDLCASDSLEHPKSHSKAFFPCKDTVKPH